MQFSELSRIVLLLSVVYTGCAGTLTGPNVCTSRISSRVAQTIPVKQSYTVKYRTSCGFWGWSTCTRTRVQYRTGYTTTYHSRYSTGYVCCSGYSSVGNKCEPVCSPACKNSGKCSSPGRCHCSAGWTGSICTTPCSSDRFGENCAQRCTCQNGASCNAITGNCTCTAGWQGTKCDQACPRGTFGLGCVSCTCKNGAACDRFTGVCSCLPGYYGQSCEYRCSSWTFGHNCSYACYCHRSNTFNCSHVSGQCDCRHGWKGGVCTDACPHGVHGPNCQFNCTCQNGATCDRYTGNCSCLPGFIGDNCEKPCPVNTYGLGCKGNCTCVNNGSCNAADGTCTCVGHWVGQYCEKPCLDEWDYWNGTACIACPCKRTDTQCTRCENVIEKHSHIEKVAISIPVIIIAIIFLSIMAVCAWKRYERNRVSPIRVNSKTHSDRQEDMRSHSSSVVSYPRPTKVESFGNSNKAVVRFEETKEATFIGFILPKSNVNGELSARGKDDRVKPVTDAFWLSDRNGKNKPNFRVPLGVCL